MSGRVGGYKKKTAIASFVAILQPTKHTKYSKEKATCWIHLATIYTDDVVPYEKPGSHPCKSV